MPNPSCVVFVVDDEPVIAKTLSIILKQAGFDAIAFDHPEKAIDAREQQHFALGVRFPKVNR